ncbi:hypothetical protein EDD36DRAFT_124372 [Exophiala viscosa]|uniref:Uncharacterized protein n=1 Tax=Exophiala viscosa TaxID=2486360 RepID=A0AAN6E0Y0_9EURO|nr:hypothetical protein EDD36DRAFT_124372 [Exophiala viscosa]
MDPDANVYGDHSVYNSNDNEGAAQTFGYTGVNQNANSYDRTIHQPNFLAGEQLASPLPRQQFTHPFHQLPQAANFNDPSYAQQQMLFQQIPPAANPFDQNYAQQPASFHQLGLTDLDVHRTCRETEARDRGTIARLRYNVQNLQNYIRLKEEEHELEIRALNERIDRLDIHIQRQQPQPQQINYGLHAPLQPRAPGLIPMGGPQVPAAAHERLPQPTYPVGPPHPQPPIIDLDADEADTPDDAATPGKRVKRSHTTMTWLDPPVSDALKRATGWLPEVSTVINPRRTVSAPVTTEPNETEDDAEADFLAHWDAAEETGHQNVEETDHHNAEGTEYHNAEEE